MNHKIVTFYAVELPNVDVITKYQKDVFKYFGLDIEQIPFSDKIPHPHSEAMTKYLSENKEWESLSIFDVDCIVTSSDTIEIAIDKIKDGNTIYGNAQATYNEIPFVAPNFFNVSRRVWERTLEVWGNNPHLHRDVFRYQTYNKGGKEIICDVAEMLNIENRKIGTKIDLSYPIRNEKNPEWRYDAGMGFPTFEWGNGTWFGSKTFHATEIRYSHKQQVFFEVCEKILNHG